MTKSRGDGWLTGDAYETYMGRWSRPLARKFVEWLDAKPLANWLEVGCGTGALTSAISDLCRPASIVACDPSRPFIEYARKNFPDARASFVIADAEALPTRDGGFDAIVSGLVLNFLPDVERALSSMRAPSAGRYRRRIRLGLRGRTGISATLLGRSSHIGPSRSCV